MRVPMRGKVATDLYENITAWIKSLTPEAIPTKDLEWKYSRSSGPGGQHVNKVSTKAELCFDIRKADWIPTKVRNRLVIDNASGKFIIKSDRFRTQEDNKQDCLVKAIEILKSFAQKMAPRPTSKEQIQHVEKLYYLQYMVDYMIAFRKSKYKIKLRELKEKVSQKKQDRKVLSSSFN